MNIASRGRQPMVARVLMIVSLEQPIFGDHARNKILAEGGEAPSARRWAKIISSYPRAKSASEIGGHAIGCDDARLVRRDKRIAGVVQAGGIEIRPRLLPAFRAQRPNVGAVALGANHRRTCLDL